MAKALGEGFMQLILDMPRKTSLIQSEELW